MRRGLLLKTSVCMAVLLSLPLTGCGKLNDALDAAASVPGQLKSVSDQTTNLEREAAIQAGFANITDPKLSTYLSPFPFDIFIVAYNFAEFINADEIVKLVDVKMSQLNTPVALILAPTATSDQKDAFNAQQIRALDAILATCGFLSDAKVQQIINTQIMADGPYRPAAEQVLALRVFFLKNYLLELKLLNAPFESVGQVELGIGYANSIEMVSRLPYASRLGYSVVRGLVAPAPAYVVTAVSLNPKNDAMGTWKELLDHANSLQDNLSKNTPVKTGNPTTDANLNAQDQQRLARAIATINAKFMGWGG